MSLELAFRERLMIVTAFFVTSMFGSTFIASYWLSNGNTGQAVSRVVAFVVLMATIHCLGVSSYCRQKVVTVGRARVEASTATPFEVDACEGHSLQVLSVAPTLRTAIWSAFGQHIALLLLTVLVLDGGHLLRICCSAIAGHWAATLFVTFRRPATPTSIDLLLVKYGVWPLVLIAGQLAGMVLPRVAP